ncbi:MAG: hypothetical protein LUE27_04180, partial [Clostridia bacterium]|nr:hypothetical protein [Clostridia bacterium]
VLSDDGEIVWNDASEQRLLSRFSSEIRRDCILFPLCAHGCSQDAYEDRNPNRCLHGFSDADINRILEEKVNSLLQNVG